MRGHLWHISWVLEIVETTSWSSIVSTHHWVILADEIIILRLLIVWVVVSLLEESMLVLPWKLLPILIALENLLLLIFKNWVFPPNFIILMVDTLSCVQMALVGMNDFSVFLVALHQHLLIPFVQRFFYLRRDQIIIVFLLSIGSLIVFHRSLTCFYLVYRLFLRAAELFRAFWETVVIWDQLHISVFVCRVAPISQLILTLVVIVLQVLSGEIGQSKDPICGLPVSIIGFLKHQKVTWLYFATWVVTTDSSFVRIPLGIRIVHRLCVLIKVTF